MKAIHCSAERNIGWDQQLTVFYYYDEKKERIIYLLLHILFITWPD